MTFILFVALMIQLAQWKNARAIESGLVPNTTALLITKAEYQNWRKRLTEIQENRQRLETQLLFGDSDTLLPVLSKVTESVDVRLVGVEAQTPRRRNRYQFFPLSITVNANYSGVAEFLAVVERITPTVRIDELNLKPNTAGDLSMRLTLTPVIKTDQTGTTLHLPDIERFAIQRNPFFKGTRPGQKTGPITPAPQPNTPRPLPILTSILFDDTQPLAILSRDGIPHTVGVGDEIYGVRITQIHAHQVTVKRSTTPFTLSLWKSNKSNHPKSTTPIAFGMED